MAPTPAQSASSRFHFTYQGGNYIPLETLLTSQFHFLALINEIQTKVDPEHPLTIKVGGFKEGSFIIDLLLEVQSNDPIAFGALAAVDAQRAISILRDILELRKFLKGKKASKVEETADGNLSLNVDGNNNTIIISPDAFAIYRESNLADKAISSSIETLEKEDTIEGIQISQVENDKKKVIAEVDRDDFHGIKEPSQYLSRDVTSDLHANQTLFIKKPDLFPENKKNWKWSFLHKGRDITATIEDHDFRQQVNNGLRLGQGDRLKADLEIHYRFDPQFNTFIETNRYVVKKVHNHIPRPEQGEFNLPIS